MAFDGLSSRASLIALIVIMIVAVLIIVEAAWTIWFTNTVVNTEVCNCSGIPPESVTSLRGYEIFMLLLGLGLLVYAIVLILIPTADKRKSAFKSIGRRFERAKAAKEE